MIDIPALLLALEDEDTLQRYIIDCKSNMGYAEHDREYDLEKDTDHYGGSDLWSSVFLS